MIRHEKGIATPRSHAADHENGGSDEINNLGGIVSFPDQSACSVYLSGAQTITHNVDERLEFDTEDYDIQGEFIPWSAGDPTNTGRFTATQAGIYSVKISVMTTEPDDVLLVPAFKVNGGVVAQGRQRKTADNQFLLTKDIALNASDYIEGFCYVFNHTDGGNVAIDSNKIRTFMTISKIH